MGHLYKVLLGLTLLGFLLPTRPACEGCLATVRGEYMMPMLLLTFVLFAAHRMGDKL